MFFRQKVITLQPVSQESYEKQCFRKSAISEDCHRSDGRNGCGKVCGFTTSFPVIGWVNIDSILPMAVCISAVSSHYLVFCGIRRTPDATSATGTASSVKAGTVKKLLPIPTGKVVGSPVREWG